MALSTLKPATSPRLSGIRLNFRSPANRPVETAVTNMGNDLRRIADEIARIEHEFGGAVNITVVPDSQFRVVLQTLNVGLSFVGWKKPRGDVDLSSFIPCRSFRTMFIEMGRLSLPPASFGQSFCGIGSLSHSAPNWLRMRRRCGVAWPRDPQSSRVDLESLWASRHSPSHPLLRPLIHDNSINPRQILPHTLPRHCHSKCPGMPPICSTDPTTIYQRNMVPSSPPYFVIPRLACNAGAFISERPHGLGSRHNRSNCMCSPSCATRSPVRHSLIGPVTNSLPPATRNNTLGILQRERDHVIPFSL